MREIMSREEILAEAERHLRHAPDCNYGRDTPDGDTCICDLYGVRKRLRAALRSDSPVSTKDDFAGRRTIKGPIIRPASTGGERGDPNTVVSTCPNCGVEMFADGVLARPVPRNRDGGDDG